MRKGVRPTEGQKNGVGWPNDEKIRILEQKSNFDIFLETFGKFFEKFVLIMQ